VATHQGSLPVACRLYLRKALATLASWQSGRVMPGFVHLDTPQGIAVAYGRSDTTGWQELVAATARFAVGSATCSGKGMASTAIEIMRQNARLN
jgi:hypothetical protein